jgi:hypothetical protein
MFNRKVPVNEATRTAKEMHMWSRIAAIIPILMLLTDAASAQQSGAGAGASYDSRAEIAVSDETLQLRYVGPGQGIGGDETRLSGAFFLSEGRDVVVSAGLQIPAEFDIGALEIVFGPQLYAALLQEENNDIMALSLGTEVRFDLIPSMGLAVTGHAYYAPDILTFGSADNITDLGARLELNATPRLDIFAGFRWFRFDLTEGGGRETLQDEVVFGVGYRF